jgi:hypothetical protein
VPLTDFVFRVERHAVPTNPYAHTVSAAIEAMQYAHGAARHTPVPDEDGIGPFTGAHVFGFASEAAARTWFAGWHRHLADEGFFLATYLVDPVDVVRGHRQLVFVRERSVRVATSSLTWH